uniref:Putative carbonic anhydrase-like protein n=1 Tax=Panstrongylus lignarius TaxID=156445 RepID=A0A224XSB8_9HEMI
MALTLNFLYFIIFCSIYCVKSEKCQLQGSCQDDKKFQSPINIQCDYHKKTSAHHTTNNEFLPLELENFNTNPDVTITNTGHTLKSMQTKKRPFIKGGPLKKKYNFAQLHFHWGSTDNEGSEHQVDGKKFPMECHFVFSRSYEKNNMKGCTIEKKSRKSCNVETETVQRTLNGNQCGKLTKRTNEAVRSSNQNVTVNVVLGVLFVISDNATKYDLLEEAKYVVEVNSTINKRGKFISQLVSAMNLTNYFTYSGSLTTPPYSTNVIWIVLQDPLPVSSDQLALLRELKSDEEGPITENFREIQELYDRVVCYKQSETKPRIC